MPELKVFTVVFFYLLFMSSYFAYIINDKENAELSGISLGDTVLTTNYQDYTINGSYFSGNLLTEGFIKSGMWEQVEDIGIVLQTDTIEISDLVIKNILPTKGEYDVIYYINNSIHQPFSIFPQYSNNEYIIEVYFDSSGYHIPQYYSLFGVSIPYGDKFFLADTNLMNEDSFKLESKFNTNSKNLIILKNDIEIINLNGLGYDSSSNVYYAGVSSHTKGFTLEKINAKIQSVSISESNGLGYTINYIYTMLSILFWSVDEIYLPLALNILIIKFPLAIATIFFIMIIRGV
jgi:hypothetical protein